MFITFKNKYLSNDMKIFGTCSIPLIRVCAYVCACMCACVCDCMQGRLAVVEWIIFIRICYPYFQLTSTENCQDCGKVVLKVWFKQNGGQVK